jgi:hypothetical protein
MKSRNASRDFAHPVSPASLDKVAGTSLDLASATPMILRIEGEAMPDMIGTRVSSTLRP